MPDRDEVVLRACAPGELGAVLRLWSDARGGLGSTDDEAALRALLDHDRDCLLIAEVEGRIVGSLIAASDGWRGNMYRLTVHPAHRRQRVATRLIEAGEGRLRSRGVRRVSALVSEEDGSAVDVWRQAGYRRDAGTARFVKPLAV
jgi:ribosomal protein S18 acetylase RimI-like enzyme